MRASVAKRFSLVVSMLLLFDGDYFVVVDFLHDFLFEASEILIHRSFTVKANSTDIEGHGTCNGIWLWSSRSARRTARGIGRRHRFRSLFLSLGSDQFGGLTLEIFVGVEIVAERKDASCEALGAVYSNRFGNKALVKTFVDCILTQNLVGLLVFLLYLLTVLSACLVLKNLD